MDTSIYYFVPVIKISYDKYIYYQYIIIGTRNVELNKCTYSLLYNIYLLLLFSYTYLLINTKKGSYLENNYIYNKYVM